MQKLHLFWYHSSKFFFFGSLKFKQAKRTKSKKMIFSTIKKKKKLKRFGMNEITKNILVRK